MALPTHWTICTLSLMLTFITLTSATVPQLAGVDGKSLFRSLRASNCQEDCSNVKRRPVCGTDGQTYASRCELKKAKKCDGRRVKVRKKGRCSESSTNVGGSSGGSKCFQERDGAKAAARHQTSEVFIPECNRDGTHAEVQCHHATGYCWCVTKDGRHIPGTSVKGRRPRCRGKRRKRKQRGRPRRRKPCSRTDRQSFNSMLVGEFTQEYKRLQSSETTPAPQSSNSDNQVQMERRIVEWKFSQLDKDSDNLLRFKEIRSFGRMVKKLIKPKSCAKKFLRFCDSNNNRRIERNEWTLCLGVDIKFSFQLFISLNSDGQTTEPPPDKNRREDVQLRPRLWKKESIIPDPSNTPEPRREAKAEKSRNCVDERNAALTLDTQEPNTNIYIPRCQPNGKWSKAQCHKATEYCWCVEEDTGMPIPGTSTHKVEPNCTMRDDREMKGCPYGQKRRFLVELMNDLTEEMARTTRNSSITRNTNSGLKLREMVAQWKLLSLDTNGNRLLERKEWKKFRKTNLKNKKYPRKCRRNFLRYCDADSNQKVTLAEWTDCMGLNHNYYNRLPDEKRRGKKNPFSKYLQER